MQQRHIMRVLLACLITAVWLGCNENTGVPTADPNPPTVSITLADTLVNINQGLQFTVSASDNISLRTIGWSVTGAVTKDTLIQFTTTTLTFSESFTITEGFAGGSFEIVATATDGSGNEAAPDTATATVFDDQFPTQTIIFPLDGAQYAAGDIIPLVVLIQDPSGVAEMVGDLFARDQFGRKVVIATATIALATPFPSAVEDTLMVLVPVDLAPGFYELGSVATDGATPQRSGDGPSIVIRVIDTTLPMATFVSPAPAGPIQAVRVGDSVRVQVQLDDTQGLSKVTIDGIAFRGSATLGTDTTVQRFKSKEVNDLNGTTDTLVIRDLNIVTPLDRTPEVAWLRAVVEDTEGNVDTAMVRIDLVAGPGLTITTPADSAQVAPGFNVGVEILAEGNLIAYVGYLTTGVVTDGDTTFFAIGSQPDTTLESFVLPIPLGTTPGFLTLFPVGLDSAGNVGTGAPITIEVVAGGGPADTEPPLILDSLELRVEVDDDVQVKGTDLRGITRLGYIVTNLAGTVVSGDSTDFGGTNTNEQVTFAMRLDTVVSTFPTQLIVTTFGLDGPGNRGANSFDGTTAIAAPGQVDTITVVAGVTKELPTGGLVADGIVNRGLGAAGEVYLTNWERDQLEVFDIATRSFGTPIPIGSRPWGIALWPVDTLGTNANMVMVANSGGTNISIVDMAGRIETRRHALPNFIIQSVESEINPETGQIEEKIEEFDFSDRPQFIGATCRPTDGMTTCAADSIYAVYSTTPTPGQTLPFPNLGTLRWENLTACDPGLGKDCFGFDGIALTGDEPDSAQSHFFWEHATIPPSPDADTLRVIAERSGTFETLLFAEQGRTVNLPSLGFRDTTFVRNSGNFTHTFIGEGGNIGAAFARVMSYDGNRALAYDTTTVITSIDSSVVPPDTTFASFGPSVRDPGISPGTEVRDFIANTAIPVRSIGTNFNGLTNLVRADSIYIINENLRLVGLIAVGGSNYGMDLNFDHAFTADAGGTTGTDGGPGDPNDRMLFAATDNPEIVVYDTWFYGEIASIPIRDPIIGPLRVAELPTGEQFLVGVTAFGVVTVQLPPVLNIFPTPSKWDDKDR